MDDPRTCCVIAVGNEVVHGSIMNRNASWLAREIAAIGLDVRYHMALPDRLEELTRRLRAALDEGMLVVVTGGIGPTIDDRTREAAAAALEAPLALDYDVLAMLQDRYAAMGRKFPEGSERQCMRPQGARLVPNAFGTACCFLARRGEGGIAVLPGVSREMRGVWSEELRGALLEEFGFGTPYVSRELRVFGMPESDLNNRVRDLLESRDAEGAILVDDAVIRLCWRVRSESPEQAERLLRPILEQARERLGDMVFAEGGISLEQATVGALREAGLTIACAESCTGGLIAHMLTNVPGSSEVLLESAVTYSNEAKTRRLGVAPTLLEREGAVSEACARAMVDGLAAQMDADICVAASGIAGPGGGTEDKPVGTVWLGVRFKGETRAWHLRVSGDRELVKSRTARSALNAVRLAAIKGELPREIAPWVAPPL